MQFSINNEKTYCNCDHALHLTKVLQEREEEVQRLRLYVAKLKNWKPDVPEEFTKGRVEEKEVLT